jgi:hypothetical protein
MAINRATFATEVANTSGDYLLTVGLLTTDTTGNLKEPLDATFRKLGVAKGSEGTATVEESAWDKALAVAEVFVIERALKRASGRPDVGATGLGVTKDQSQMAPGLREALREAVRRAAQYGVSGIVPVMSSGSYTIDVLEPTAEENAA